MGSVVSIHFQLWYDDTGLKRGGVMSLSQRLPLDRLGAIEQADAIQFGLWLPWIDSRHAVEVLIIHEQDQYLQDVPPRVFPLDHSLLAPHGDFWSVRVPRPTPTPGSAWGQLGRYVYRYRVTAPDGRVVDWVVDPFAREYGSGKLSAFTLGYQPYVWDEGELSWQTPALADLVLYEINIAEFAGSLERAERLLAYLADLGVNAIEIMPLSNVGGTVDWGYLPLGYFGVDERFGRRDDLQALVALAHRYGIAVIVDVVYGHTGDDFPYVDLYRRLGFADTPFNGPFAKDYFGQSTDFGRALTRDFFFTANLHWLEVYHIDGFRYDCVPNYWDGPLGQGYANLVYQTWRETAACRAEPYWRRFDAGPGAPLTLVQCAEQLEAPEEILAASYSNGTWQNRSFAAAKAVAQGDRGRLAELGLSLGLFGYPDSAPTEAGPMPKLALQYIENHDHERFICNFGLRDAGGDPLLREGDRDRWFMLQPYLIALLLARGVPMLWQGQEFADNHFLPDEGFGRVALLRPLRWDDFYDAAGQGIVRLVRRLLRIRRAHAHLRGGAYYFFNDWERYQQHGLLLFARYDGAAYTLVAVNTSDSERTVPFWFPLAGDYGEELHGGGLDLHGVPALQPVWLTIPSHYGRVWTRR